MTWQPLPASDRYLRLDLLRGFALFGVLIVNLLYFFRLSLFEHLLNFHTHPGWVNHTIDVLVAAVFEFKAFTLFSLTFGIGVAVQTERAGDRAIRVSTFLLRRFLILLAFGLIHMLLISNADILTLYAVCGVLMIPVLRLPAAVLAVIGLAAVYLPTPFPRGPMLPTAAVMQEHAMNATRTYSHGSFAAMTAFRWHETRDLIAPLLIGSAQRTFGLMLLGVAIWRFGIVRDPERYRRALWSICVGAGAIGVINTTAHLMHAHIPAWLVALGSEVPLAFAYAAALLAWRMSHKAESILAPVAAAGRMALSNYLMQSIIFAFIFYSYGLGLFGQLTPAPTAAIGVAVYLLQLWFSTEWLKRYLFGPFEWVWRSLTYGRRQPMRRVQPLATLDAT
jgi:uncharacterized protein